MPLLQAELVARLKAALTPATTGIGQLVLLNDTRSSFSFTSSNVNAATGVLTVTGHNFFDAGNGTRIQFPSAAPGGLTLNQDYWVRAVSGSNFQISATPGGSAISSFSSAGSGTMTVSDQALSASDQNLASPGANNAQWLRKEIGTRLSINTPAAAAYTIQNNSGTLRSAVSLTGSIDNSAGSATLIFSKLLLLIGGSLTVGDTGGTPQRWWETAGNVPAGQITPLSLTAFESN